MASLYLCRINPDNDRLIACLGTITEAVDGYRFRPWTDMRKPSRKGHPTISAAIPRWCDESVQGYCRLLDKNEFAKAKS